MFTLAVTVDSDVLLFTLQVGYKWVTYEKGMLERRANFRAFPLSHALLTSTPKRIIAS